MPRCKVHCSMHNWTSDETFNSDQEGRANRDRVSDEHQENSPGTCNITFPTVDEE